MPDVPQPPTPDSAQDSPPRRPSRVSIPLPGATVPPEGLHWPPAPLPSATAAGSALPAPLPRPPSTTALPPVPPPASAAALQALPAPLASVAPVPAPLPRMASEPVSTAVQVPAPPAVSPLPRVATPIPPGFLATPAIPRAADAPARPTRPAHTSLTPPPVAASPSPFDAERTAVRPPPSALIEELAAFRPGPPVPTGEPTAVAPPPPAFEEKTALRATAPVLLAMATPSPQPEALAAAAEAYTPAGGTRRPAWAPPEVPSLEPGSPEATMGREGTEAEPPVTPPAEEDAAQAFFAEMEVQQEAPVQPETAAPPAEDAPPRQARPRRARLALVAVGVCALAAAGAGLLVRRPYVMQLPAQLASLQRTPLSAPRSGRLVTVPPAPGTLLEAGATVAQLEDPRLEEDSRQAAESLRQEEEALATITRRLQAGASPRGLKAEQRRVASLGRAIAALDKKVARLERRRHTQRQVARERTRREGLEKRLTEARARLSLTEEALQPEALARHEAQVEALRAKRAELLASLQQLQVRAQVGGRVVASLPNAVPGREVAAGDVLAEVVPTGRPRVELSVRHPEARQVQQGMAVRFLTASAPLSGRVLAVWPGPTDTQLSVELEQLPSPPTPGLSGTLEVAAGERPLAQGALEGLLSLGH